MSKVTKLGNHILMQGDCLELMKDLPDGSVDLIVTDPPYDNRDSHRNMFRGVKANVKGTFCHGIRKMQCELHNTGICDSWSIEEVGREMLRVCKRANIYIWCNKAQLIPILDFFVTQNKKRFELLTWHKTNQFFCTNRYMSMEFCVYIRDGDHCRPQTYEDGKPYWIEARNTKDKKKWEHPTIKPLHMIEKLVRNSSRENDVVLDCFMGSGATGVACVNTGRKFIGMEIDEKYFDIAARRIAEAQKARKDMLFSEMR